MKPRVYGWLCLGMLLAVTLLIGPFGKQRLAAEHSVLSGQSQHSLEAAAKASLQESRVRVEKSYLGLPLSFEANRGQTDAQVKYLSRGQGYTLFLTRGGDAVLALREPGPTGDWQKAVKQGAGFKALESRAANRTAVVRMHVVGGNARPEVEGVGELSGKANYFIGKDATKWRRKVPLFSKVIYRQVYRGVDLVYYGQQRELEHDFVVAPGSDPHSITLRFAGTRGMSLDSSGALVLEVEGGQVRFEKPRMYQEVQGARKEVPGGYVLKDGHDIGFEVASYDASQPLVIDPTLAYSTYLGGSGYDQGRGIAVDAAGNAYVTGNTSSTDFPTTPGAFQSSKSAGIDAFVTALNSDGSGLIYSTYLGTGSGFGIAVDAAGNAYVTGDTSSRDFPTTPGAFQSAKPGRHNAFVTALNSDGSGLIYSTYLGGSDSDVGLGIALDARGNAYITGYTFSSDFPTTPDAFQSSKPASTIFTSAFVTALNSDGSGLIYSTYLGGSDSDLAWGIAVRRRHREDQERHEARHAVQVYVTGLTHSADFPTTPGAFQSTKPGRSSNAFVTALNSDGSGLVYSTYLGGSLLEEGRSIALDTAGDAYVTGFTASRDFPTTPDAFQTSILPNRGATIGFVTALNSDGSGLIYSTYLGGSDYDQGLGIAVDTAGNAYVTGFTASPDFPTTPDAFQSQLGGLNAFVTALNSHGSKLIYSTYLGGSAFDRGWGIAVRQRHREDQEGHETRRAVQVYVTGDTDSRDFPTTPNAFQPAYPGGRPEGFVAKVSGFQQCPAQSFTSFDVLGSATFAQSINSCGAITGYWISSGFTHGFLRDPDGTITSFDPPDSRVTLAQSINDDGAITGYYFVGDSVVHGFLRDPDGTITSFDVPGAARTEAQSINASGAITGYSYTSDFIGHGFLRDPDGTITSFDVPGSIETYPLSINASGAITGYYSSSDFHAHGFLRDPDGTFTSIDPPGSVFTHPVSINDHGAITGNYVSSARHGFLRNPDGTFTSFDLPDSTTILPRSINDDGAITGNYFTAGAYHGFLRSPDGTITSFDPPVSTGPAGTTPLSINASGAITGYYASSGIHGFVFR